MHFPFKKTLTALTLVAYASVGTLLPAARAWADSVTVDVGGTSVTYPKLDWQTVGDYNVGADGGVRTSVSGDAAQVGLNDTAAAIGKSAGQVADLVKTLPSDGAVVLARYSPMNQELRVDIVKVTKSRTNVHVAMAQFGPDMGNTWAAARTFMSAGEKATNPGPGPNPFARYSQSGDGVFHGLSEQYVQTVVGSAMRYSGATIGLTAVLISRLNQYKTTSGGWLRKTVTYHFEDWKKPQWYIAFPAAMGASDQGIGTSGTDSDVFLNGGPICAVNENPCQGAHTMLSGVSFQQWKNGSLSEDETMAQAWTESHSGWTLLAFVLLAVVTSWAAGSALLAMGAQAANASFGAYMASLALGAGQAAGSLGAALLIGGGVIDGAIAGLAAGTITGTGATGVLFPQAGYTTAPVEQPSSPYVQGMMNNESVQALQAAPTASNGNPAVVQGFTAATPDPNRNLDYNSFRYVQDTQ
ncbi:hypothetical protein F6X40_10615 [Paraburkholderia sp. UCT31]|uniref:hypothetical protein n=1 Tax=Paraburkholderia sp. UCT31 TaxID=2615209 RepID=UPI001654D555|nr:hypothetical protein [Paraburkholderia sp. UCT31]MBC8737260.1 hypothetical protein [Paraburkholderia sp. UCT31]